MTRRKKDKSPHDVRGWQISCPNYQQCPLCYGCRAFDPSVVKCLRCEEDGAKKNICDTSKHLAVLLAMMIQRERIEVTSYESA